MSISGVLNTSEGTMSAWGRGISWIHWGMFSTLGDIMMHVGDTMRTLRDVQYIGISWVHWGDIMSTLGVSIEIERIYQVSPPNASWYPSDVLNIPQCTHDIYIPPPPQCTNGIQPWCTEHLPMCTWYPPTFIMISPDVLNMPQCAHDIPPCTEHPLMYWISPNLLNTHTRWTFYG